jgi:uncharacterized protein (DUF427 family)
MWNFRGDRRPPFAVEPGPGQESVWDYPRPPAIRADSRLVEVTDGAAVLARSARTFRVCETASPPTFYFPPGDVDLDQLVSVKGSSYCEWKGRAVYWALAAHPEQPVAWSYPKPRARFGKWAGYFSFYPGRVACYVSGERVKPQAGGFYGGWITSEITGPFKGDPGTGNW